MCKKLESENKNVDRGWSWIIALACCLGSLILAGIFRTSGVLFVAFISTFGVSRKAASWPMVVCIAVLNLTGPFSGMLGQRFGVRPVVIAGAIIATIGISSCYFTTSLTIITVLFGVVFGIGYGFMNTLMPVILNAYFLNLRATANGLANSGSCIGSIILPIVFEYLIASYGLSGCFLLTGAIVLHLTIAGALMRPHPLMERKTGENVFECSSLHCDKANCDNELDSNSKQNNTYSKLSGAPNETACKCEGKPEEMAPLNPSHDGPPKVNAVESDSYESSRTSSSNASSQKACIPSEESTTNMPSSTVIESFKSVLSCPMFHVTALTNVCFYFLFHMYVVVIVDYALDRKVQDVDTKNILFAFAISDMFGRLGLGWITDRQFMSRPRFVMLCLFLIGLVFYAFPYADGYISLIVISCLYGLLLGCTMVLYPILLVDFCGIELHAIAYGCMCFMNGFASFGRPFLIGYFRDGIGSYSSMFYVLGTLSVVSSGLWLFGTCFLNKRDVKLKTTEDYI